MPLDIIQHYIFTGSINIRAHSCDYTIFHRLATPHLSLHWIGCKHIPSYVAFPVIKNSILQSTDSNILSAWDKEPTSLSAIR